MNKQKQDKALYFIALVPDEPIYSELWQLKEERHERCATKAALRSPPHMTLHMPFNWDETKEEALFKVLAVLAAEHKPLALQLNNFGAFEPRVIYVKIDESDELNLLQKAVTKAAAAKWHIYPRSDSRSFRAHMTIAFRDLKKPKFHEAWEEFAFRNYSRPAPITSLSLLKHNGRIWEIYKSFSLNSAAN